MTEKSTVNKTEAEASVSSRSLFDYIAEETATFAEKPFTVEDSILFTQLAYLHLGGYVKPIRPLYTFSASLRRLSHPDILSAISQSMRIPEDTCRLLTMAAESRRFGKTRVKYFEERTDLDAEKQFAAVTFLLDNNLAFVAYRGTDNTIVGWRENFNMAYMTPVPSQTDSAEYLRTVINRLRTRKIYVGGHSKGGNLAVYAAAHCGIAEQQRILGIYNLDGPGFKDDILKGAEMRRIKDRLHNILPRESMIGTLLRSVGSQTIVNSRESGFEQHNPLNWVFEKDRLQQADSLSKDAIVFDRVIDNWLDSLTNPQRELIVDTMFEIIAKSGAETFNDVMVMLKNGDINAIRVIKDMDPERRRQLIPLFKNLGVEYLKAKISRQKQ